MPSPSFGIDFGTTKRPHGHACDGDMFKDGLPVAGHGGDLAHAIELCLRRDASHFEERGVEIHAAQDGFALRAFVPCEEAEH